MTPPHENVGCLLYKGLISGGGGFLVSEICDRIHYIKALGYECETYFAGRIDSMQSEYATLDWPKQTGFLQKVS